MRIRKVILLLLITAIRAAGENHDCYSSKYGFVASFPKEFEKTEVKSASGPMASFTAVIDKEAIVLTINAQKMVAFKDLAEKSPPEAVIKNLIKKNFDSYAKASGLKDIKSEWLEDTAFPVLKNTFVETDFFARGVSSHEASYWMLVGDTFYRVVAKGLEAEKLMPHLERLYGGFLLADPEFIKKAEQASSGQPATRPESKSERRDKPQPEAEGRSR